MKKQQLHPFLLLLLIITLLVTRSQWLDTNLEYLLAAAGIIVTGIPHGAMDHHTASFLNGAGFKLLRYLLQYLFFALLYLAVWFLYPGFAFILFLVLTAWHFGETDLECFGKKNTSPFLVFIYGWSLLMWLLLKDTATILYWTDLITGKHIFARQFIQTLTGIPHGLWFAISASILIYNVYRDQSKWRSVSFFLIFIFLSVYTSLLLGFVVYFAGWHSLQALQHLRTYVFQRAGVKKIILTALPAVAGSLVILFVILQYGAGSWIENNGLPSLFILLSVLTLPHMVQMHKLYQLRSN